MCKIRQAEYEVQKCAIIFVACSGIGEAGCSGRAGAADKRPSYGWCSGWVADTPDGDGWGEMGGGGVVGGYLWGGGGGGRASLE